jgi:2',3'-cyclic-nucleotide 2'-phosphodiesterase (5'-nucleotidase family)
MKKGLMIPLLFAVLLLFSCASQQSDGREEGCVSITFYHTSDIHEHAEPMPRIARYVKSRKKDNPNTLFVDSGDWFNKGDLTELNTRGEAIAAILSGCEYDAMIPGNHDYSFGTPRLTELIDQYSLPIVAANCRWPEDIKPEHAAPYRIFDLEGVMVAIIGMASPITRQQIDSLLQIQSIEESTKSIGDVVARLDDHVDIIVLLTHLGKWMDTRSAQALPGVDIIFGGHDHSYFREVHVAEGTDTIIQHSGYNGNYIGELIVTWNGDKIIEPKVRLIEVTDEMPEAGSVKRIWKKYLSQAEKSAMGMPQ